MVRILIATGLCLGVVSEPAFAADPSGVQDMDALVRHYGASELERGSVEVTREGDVAWVRGTVEGGPWLDVWRRSAGGWKLVAELQAAEIPAIRFGTRRHRPCSRTS